MSPSARDLISALFRTRSAVMVDIEPTGPEADTERLLILSNLSGTMQLCEWVGDQLLELTALPESVSHAAYVPGSEPRQAVISSAVGGNERDQLYVIDLDAAAADPVRRLNQLGELGQDPAGQGDVAQLHLDIGGGGEGTDDRQQRLGGQRRRLVGVGVDDLHSD
jgi:hypothetical protein